MKAVLWRAFPWDAAAAAGAPFSPSYLPERQETGRFDLAQSLVLYLAESPEHALAETIQSYRGLQLRGHHLRRSGRALALAPVRVADSVWSAVVDLCDPDELARRRIGPDTLASRDFTRTRAVAEALYQDGRTGLRWWSAFSGDWHTLVVFCGRLSGADLEFGQPERVGLVHPAVRGAAAELGIRLAGSKPVRT
jgi:hypothetical protein